MLRNVNYSSNGKRILGTPKVGVLGSAIPTESLIYPSLDLPGDANKYYSAVILTRPSVGVLTTYENGAWEYDPQGAVGQQSFTAQLKENGVSIGSPITISINVLTNATVSSVSITPKTVNVNANGNQQFGAVASGTNNPPQTFIWSSTGGSINASTGLFTAPAGISTPQTITITATSTLDGTKSDTAVATIPGVIVSTYPSVNDVRHGVIYGGNNEFTGTMVSGSGVGVFIGGVGISSDGHIVIGV